MFSSFFKPLYYLVAAIIILVIFITCFFTPFYMTGEIDEELLKQMERKRNSNK